MKAVVFGGLGLLVAAVTYPAVGQEPAAQSSDIAWNDKIARKSLELKRVVTQIPASEPVGSTGFGIFCGQPEPIRLTRTGDMDPREYRQRFNAETVSAGYGDTVSDSLFENVKDAKPTLQVAAAITALNIKTCVIEPLGSGRSTATMTIEWQVLDPLERKIVFRGTTHSEAKVDKNPSVASEAAMGAAFSNAVRSLLAMPEFQQITTQVPAGQTAFDTPQNPPSVTWITSLPLSSTPIQNHLKEVQTHVVTVRVGGGHGSGFYIADGLLLTNHHVAAEGSFVKIHFLSGKEISGQVIASNARRDVALIKTDPVDLVGLPIRRELPEVGSHVFVIGSPLDQQLEGTVSSGIVSAIRVLEHDHNRYIQSDAGIQGGNSGGPMFDDNGNVVAMTVSAMEPAGAAVGLNFFIPIAEALDSLGIASQPATVAKVVTKASVKKKAAP
jgi:S1-C subfamily serine protease